MSLDDLYRRTILEHAKAPRFGAIPTGASGRARANNPLCGDRIDVGVVVEAGAVTAVGCEVKACSICVAAASLMAVVAVGRTCVELGALAASFGAFLACDDGASANAELGELRAFGGVARVPSRRRCAQLPWDAALAAIESSRTGRGEA